MRGPDGLRDTRRTARGVVPHTCWTRGAAVGVVSQWQRGPRRLNRRRPAPVCVCGPGRRAAGSTIRAIVEVDVLSPSDGYDWVTKTHRFSVARGRREIRRQSAVT